jgi:hypothetical protein
MNTHTITIADALTDPELFQPWFPGETWDGWRAVLKAAYALPMTGDEVEFFRTVAERDPPKRRVRELWCIVGRRGGKDSVASVIAAHSAALFSEGDRLRPGERALVMCLAVDRDQAKVVLNYTRSFFTDIPLLQHMVERETATGFELNNKIDIAIATNSFRSVRGRPVLCAILDELAFWRDETSATPDEQTYKAILPALASIPGSILIGISSPYRRNGLLWRKYREHFGKDGDVLVIQAPTRTLNPLIDPAIIEAALVDDPAAAACEWLAQFRDDIAGFLDEPSIDAAVDMSRPLELPPREGVAYLAFVDASAGRHDAFCIGIAPRDGDTIIADVIRGRKPPFDPATVAGEFAALAKEYRCTKVTGDNYSGEWVAQAFKAAGVDYTRSELPKSGLYLEGLPAFSRGAISIPDHPLLIRELRLLERRTARSGKDSVDHGPSGSDDHANVLFGAMYLLRRRPNLEINIGGCISVSAGPRPAWLETDDYGPNTAGFGASVGGL